ncbi:MAG: hypothetical protein AAF488_10930, partial [Planctomycetota bacterium]
MFQHNHSVARAWALSLTLAAFAFTPPQVRADDAPPQKPIIGTVRSVEDGGQAIVVRVGSKNYRVTGVDRCPKRAHRVTKLGEVKNGSAIHLLCRYQEAVNGPGAGQDLDP